MIVRLLRVVTFFAALCAVDAFGAQQRSFVASYGLDTNSCNLANPCRSFNVAIGATLAGGEVVILDTAGYGPMTINKSIKVIGPAGVYGGISVLGAGSGITTGITIAAGSADVITLRGLDISGVASIAPLPQLGIDIQSAGAVHIEKTSIGNFTQDTSACVRLDSPVQVHLYIVDSFLRECRRGVVVSGSGANNSTRVIAEIDNTRIEHPLNTVTNGRSGLRVIGNFTVTLRNSMIVGVVDGIHATNTIPTALSRLYVINSHITQADTGAIETDGGGGAGLIVNVSNSVLAVNYAAILLGHGAARLTNNQITNNDNSIVNCGSGNVVSLGYGSPLGSNLITDNTDSVVPAGCTSFITPAIVNAK